MKILAALTICGMLGTLAQPAIAETTQAMPTLPPWAQLGVCGLLGFLLWWLMAKTIPKISESNNEGLKALASEITGLRNDQKAHMQEQLQILRDSK